MSDHIEGFHLSLQQYIFWFIDQLEAGDVSRIRHATFRIRGGLDAGALGESLAGVAARHEVLRTSFTRLEGWPLQVIHDDARPELRFVDLGGLPAEEREAEVQRLLAEEARSPFDLERAPLLRACLFKLGEDEHVLSLTAHPIVCDAWSLGIIVRELFALYRASRDGAESSLPEAPVQYADYAEWQREMMESEGAAPLLSYWREKLGGVTPLELPTDRPRPAVLTQRGAARSVTLPEELSARLEELGRRHDATLFMTLLAAFYVLLHRHTGREDIVVGTTVAARPYEEMEGMVGPTENMLALRTAVRGRESFEELLARVREVVLGAYAHQDVPFEKVVEELQPNRDLSRAPVFQVTFEMLTMPAEDFDTAGLSLTPLRSLSATTDRDLKLVVERRPGGLLCHLEYNSDLFDGESAARMLGHFETLLRGVVGDGYYGYSRYYDRGNVSELPLLSEAERRLMLYEWNDTAREYPYDRLLHELFVEQAARTPDAVAVSSGTGALTYRELNERANRLAHFLQRQGFGPEQSVGILLERSAEMVVALLGTLKAGAAYLPLDPRDPRERLAFMLEDAGVSVLLTQERFGNSIPETSARVVFVEDYEHEAGRDEAWSPHDAASAENLAYVIYTSGSTGRPKGVMMTHRAAVNRLRWMQTEVGCSAEDRVLHKAPPASDVSVWEIFLPLLCGARLVLPDPGLELDPYRLREFVAEQGVTVLHFVPTALREFLRAPATGGARPRVVISSGEALAPGLAREFFKHHGGTLYNLYGPTETAADSTSHRCVPPDGDAHSVPIGRPIHNTRVYLLDRSLQPVPVGVAGELHVGGVGLARGYLQRPGLTAEKFIPDPFAAEPGSRMYRTGDVACYLPDGEIEFLGRSDDQVKLRGFRVEPGEIEAALRRHPSVQEAVVVARADARGEMGLVAYFVADSDFDAGELRASLAEVLPDYMIPSSFVRLDSLPFTPNGKVDRLALPEPEYDWRTSADFVAPRTPLEQSVAEIFAQVLGVERVGVHDNFFELGGHSLLALQFIRRVRNEIGVELPLNAIYREPTVESLARLIQSRMQNHLLTNAPPVAQTPPAGWAADISPPPGSASGTDDGLRGRLEGLLREYEECRRSVVELEARMLHLRRLLEEVGQDVHAAVESSPPAATSVAYEDSNRHDNDATVSAARPPSAVTHAPARSSPCPDCRAAVYLAEGELTGLCKRCVKLYSTSVSDPFTLVGPVGAVARVERHVAHVTCPECFHEFRKDRSVKIGDSLECDACGSKLEVVSLDPPELDVYEADENDCGDDEDDDW